MLYAPVCAIPGDRLILRNAQASRTIAGGLVLDPYAPTRKRRSAERMAYLDAIERLISQGDFGALIAQAPHGMALSQLMRLSGRALQAAGLAPHAIHLPMANGDALVMDSARWQALQAKVLQTLERFHEKSPDEPGKAMRRRRAALTPGSSGAFS